MLWDFEPLEEDIFLKEISKEDAFYAISSAIAMIAIMVITLNPATLLSIVFTAIASCVCALAQFPFGWMLAFLEDDECCGDL